MIDLAVQAHDAEQEHVVESMTEVRDEMAARDLLLRLAKLTETEQELKKLREAIADRYAQRLAGIEHEKAELRSSLETFILRFRDGKGVSFPDAGSAYLTTKNRGGKVKLADADAFAKWLVETGNEGLVKVKPVVDAKASLELAHDALFYTRPDGILVHRDTGEVLDIPGVAVEPECKTLAVRKAS